MKKRVLTGTKITAVLGALAFWIFQRRDVQGATGGG